MGVQIEELTGKVWDNCFQPILSKVSSSVFSSSLNIFYEFVWFCPLWSCLIMNYGVIVFCMVLTF